ncbi:MAG: DNA alkylation repair protein [Coriobacteriia bacterium]
MTPQNSLPARENFAPSAQTAVGLVALLRTHADPANVAGMARFGISTAGTLGVSMAVLRDLAKPLLRAHRNDLAWRHEVAGALWDSGVHEARILAALIDEPSLVTREQALAWASASDSWDITDQLCIKLLDRTSFAFEIAAEWTSAEPEFVKRAGFALIAVLAWHDKAAPDERFLPFLDLIEREAHDSRNFVTKAIDWALRHIGKRSIALHAPALAAAHRLAGSDDRATRRVGRVSARELESEKVLSRLGLLGR